MIQNNNPYSQVVLPEPSRWMTHPIKGMATMEPRGTPSSARPSVPSDICSFSLISGKWVIQDPNMKLFTANTIPTTRD